jgi:hypothetical protein
MIRRLMNEFERIWLEAVVAIFKVGLLSQHLRGETEKNNEKMNQDSRSPGRDLNQRPPENEERMLTTRLLCSCLPDMK